ncbi:MAG: hypothetical protein AAF456_07730 [Planctomycetota bacterium]
MAKVSIIFGVLLIVLGIIGFTGASPASTPPDSGSAAEGTADAENSGQDGAADDKKDEKIQYTALIPAGFGLGLVICGLIALKETMLKHGMHGAAMIGLLGFLAGAGRGGMGLGKFFSGDPELNMRSFVFVWLMALICAVFVALCVRSFIQARKAREAAEAAAG